MEKKIMMALTKEEVNNLKRFCDDNLAVGYVEICQEGTDTKVQVKNLPETLTDITDREYLYIWNL